MAQYALPIQMLDQGTLVAALSHDHRLDNPALAIVQYDCLHTQVGLAIDTIPPQEIAVSNPAEMVAAKYGIAWFICRFHFKLCA